MSFIRGSLRGPSCFLVSSLAVLGSCGSSGGGGGPDPAALSLRVTVRGELSARDCVTERSFQVESNRPLAALQVRQELVFDGVVHPLGDWRALPYASGREVKVALWKGENVLSFRGKEAEGDWVTAPAEVVPAKASAHPSQWPGYRRA